MFELQLFLFLVCEAIYFSIKVSNQRACRDGCGCLFRHRNKEPQTFSQALLSFLGEHVYTNHQLSCLSQANAYTEPEQISCLSQATTPASCTTRSRPRSSTAAAGAPRGLSAGAQRSGARDRMCPLGAQLLLASF